MRHTLLIGCKKAVEAPDTIEEMMNLGSFIFSMLKTILRSPILQSVSFVAENLDDAETGWQINSLSLENLEAAGVDVDAVENVVGASASVSYKSSVDDVLRAISWPNKSEVLDNVKQYDIIESDDLDCFLAKECDRYEMQVATQVAKAGILERRHKI